MNILVIAAHPDDEILGVGGTIAKYIRNNNRVYVYIVTDGSSSQYIDMPEIGSKKEKEMSNALSVLGVERVFRGKFPDMKLDTVAHIELNREIGKIIEEINPEIIYTHFENDVNKDHQKIFESTLVNVRPNSKNNLKEVYCYETLSSTEWGAFNSQRSFVPNVYEVLTEEDIKKKCLAMNEYMTELREYPHPRSIEGIKNLAKYRGNSIGENYAEAFYLIRKIKKELSL